MYQVAVDSEAVDYVRALYAPRDHEVFQLVPHTFNVLAKGFHLEMGSPAVTRTNVWEVYIGLQRRFIALEAIPEQSEWHSSLTQAREEAEARDAGESIELLPNQEELPEGQPLGEGYFYMGGVNGGLGLGAYSCTLATMLFFLSCHSRCRLKYAAESDAARGRTCRSG